MTRALLIAEEELKRSDNALVHIEMHRERGGPILLDPMAITRVVSAFADLTSAVSDQTIGFAVVDVRQGSLIIRLLPYVIGAHQHRSTIADYAQIFSLPIALLAMFGVGTVSAQEGNPSITENAAVQNPYARDARIRDQFHQFPQSFWDAGVDYIVIRIPDAPSLTVRARSSKARKKVLEQTIAPTNRDDSFLRELIADLWRNSDVVDVSLTRDGKLIVRFEDDMGSEGPLSVEEGIARQAEAFEREFSLRARA
ncbi:hypothetical protein ACFOKI_07800 [Sphingomonas qilianensis]|uniref:Uncharacterized protein n=1 Tax=Sphingomonas qilianensis TaxID=1736690 RepID=A0ABU9XWR6_9SPHN